MGLFTATFYFLLDIWRRHNNTNNCSYPVKCTRKSRWQKADMHDGIGWWTLAIYIHACAFLRNNTSSCSVWFWLMYYCIIYHIIFTFYYIQTKKLQHHRQIIWKSKGVWSEGGEKKCSLLLITSQTGDLTFHLGSFPRSSSWAQDCVCESRLIKGTCTEKGTIGLWRDWASSGQPAALSLLLSFSFPSHSLFLSCLFKEGERERENLGNSFKLLYFRFFCGI